MNDLFLAVLSCSLIMSILSVGWLLISKLLKKKQSARWRYAVWWLLGIGFLFPFKPAIFGKALCEFGEPAAKVIRYIDSSGTLNVIEQEEDFRLFNMRTKGELLLFLLWIVGMTLTAYLMFRRQRRFQHSMQRLRQPADSMTKTMLQLTCIDLDIPCNFEICTLPVIVSPMMTGLFHPIILMPEHKYEPEELRLILKHELLHYMHGDLWCKLLWMGCRAMHWFNPLMGLFMRRMEHDCELACDEDVMRGESPEAAGIYCNSILETALHQVRTGKNTPVLATNYAGSKDMLKERMDSVLSRRTKRRYIAVVLLTAAGVVLTGQIFSKKQREMFWTSVPQQTVLATTHYDDAEMPVSVAYPAVTTAVTDLSGRAPTRLTTSTTVTPLSQPAVYMETTSAVPVMTTVIYGADGMIYAVSAYAGQTSLPPYVTAETATLPQPAP